MHRRWLNAIQAAIFAATLLGGAGRARAAEAVPSSHLHNVFVVTPKIISGSSPDDEAGFAELAKLGVKTILSVDGGPPDVETAKKFGLKYVHLPFGYDGIPARRAVELVKAAQTLDGPIYVHCHHGKHRGPAAVAVMCEAVAGWSTNRAELWLKQAGTAAEYPGLYRAAREFKLPGAAELAAVKSRPEIAPTSSLVETMVLIDERMERLKGAQQTGWKSVPGHPEVRPAHEAMLLREHFRELARATKGEQHPADYSGKLAGAERLADQFRVLLNQNPGELVKTDALFEKLGQSCTGCHRAHRN